MLKKTLLFTFILILLVQSTAFAQTGAIIMEDVLYGLAIGGLLGSAVYLIGDDQGTDVLLANVGTGAGLGAIAGFILGLTEIRGVVEIENNEMKVALPTIYIQERDEALFYSANLLKLNY